MTHSDGHYLSCRTKAGKIIFNYYFFLCHNVAPGNPAPEAEALCQYWAIKMQWKG